MRMSSFKSWKCWSQMCDDQYGTWKGDIDITDIHDVHMGQILEKLC